MIVELVGLPGSGKSTFARRLEREAGFTRVSVRGPMEILWYNALFELAHPFTACKEAWWLIRHLGPSGGWYTKFVNLYLVHNAKYMKARKYPRAIIDQGHHQNVISLFDHALSRAELARYLSFLPKPHILIHASAAREEREKRIAERGYGARTDRPEDERARWVHASEENDGSLAALHSSLGFPVIELISETAEEEAKIFRALRPWYFVMRARMPTEKAHGLQIAKTLEAIIGSGELATLIVPKRQNEVGAGVKEFYGLSCEIPTRKIGTPDLISVAGTFGGVAYWLDALCFLLGLSSIRIDREGVYVTRNPEVAWMLALRGARVLFEAHFWPKGSAPILPFLLRRSAGIIANSEGTAAEFRKRGFRNVAVVRNGVDIERFRNAPKRDDARRTLGLPEGKIVMYTGAFYDWKGVGVLIRAWARLRARDATLVLVGGTEADLEKDGAAAYKEGGDAKIVLVPHEKAERIPVYLAAADVLVLPNAPTTLESERYTSPIKLFEYMGAGRPIVASDLPSIREILPADAGLFVRPGDDEALAEGIRKATDLSLEDAAQLSRRTEDIARGYTWVARAEALKKYGRE